MEMDGGFLFDNLAKIRDVRIMIVRQSFFFAPLRKKYAF
jgi:hypothetical protein